MKTNKKIAGFTLIELIIAMAVVAIGLSLTLPAMKDFTDANKQAEQINKLVGDITTTKNEAINRGETMCIRTATNTPVWDGGWRIEDTAVPPNVIRNATTTAIVGQTLSSAGGSTSACFRPDGSIAAAVAIEQCKVCLNAPLTEKQITVSGTGRIALNPRFACVGPTPNCPP